MNSAFDNRNASLSFQADLSKGLITIAHYVDAYIQANL